MTNKKPLRVIRNGRKRLLSSAVTSSRPLPVLPDELIREILLRLPARSLLRLQSVCSSWRTLISSSQFANDHVRRSIAADPSSGFGYDHVNDKYKLVEILHEITKCAIRIYTFCRNPCKSAIQDIPIGSIKGDGRGVFVPGTATLNWIRSHSTIDFLVLSLNLVNEIFTEFSMPLNNQYNKTIFPQLCLLRNCLACFNHEKIHWSVWVMKEYGVSQSWTKFVIIPCHPRLSSRLSGDHLRPLYIWKNVIMAVTSSSKIVLYNFDNGSFKFPVLEPTSASPSVGLYVHIYHESLVSPSYRGLQVAHLKSG
ncbi:F-box/kelch-repeat protein At3g23880-like [Arachis hypogaea]|uniref:F-box/kelch-repeat protein At3g23880-like n=1 Tax=Arachis hypogaea TaxID=3818 RepID=UPI003B22256A